jgi:hypothetical protein
VITAGRAARTGPGRRRQRLRLPRPVDADDVAEVARATGLDAGERVLEHRRRSRFDTELPRRGEEGIRRRLALQALRPRGEPVDPQLEEVLEAGGLEHFLRVRARGDDRARQARLAHRLEVAHRALVRLDAVAPQEREHEVVLAVAQAVDGLGAGLVVGGAVGELDPARGEERTHAVVARLAVDVVGVVVVGERRERVACALRALAQVVVEHLLPRLRVDGRRLRQHAVEVEQAGLDVIRESEHRASLSGRSPDPGSAAGVA